MATIREVAQLGDALVPLAISHPARPFLAAIEERKGGVPLLRLHTSKATGSRADRRDLLARTGEVCCGMSVRVEAHGSKSLHEATSLEAFVRPMKGEILFDPTGSIRNARRLVTYAGQLRDEFGLDLKGVFWSGEWRTVYIIFDAERTFVDGKIKVSFLRDAELAARRLVLETCGADATDFVGAVRLGFEAPPVPVIAVDRRSDWLAPTVINALRLKLRTSALAAAFGLGTAGVAAAADAPIVTKAPPPAGPAPAVSGPNGKIAIMGGAFRTEFVTPSNTNAGLTSVVVGDEGAIGIAEGSYSVPLGHQYGFQTDGAIGFTDSDHFMWGVGAHLFWRDPSRALLGLVASHSEREMDAQLGSSSGIVGEVNRKVTRVGGEAELYYRDFTIAAIGGYQWAGGQSNFNDGNTVRATRNDGLFGSLDLIWYSNENVALSIGAEYSEGPGAFVTAGIEMQSGLTGLSFFADGAYGENDQYRAFAGIRYYFGAAPKSLKNRHRYDDPQTNLATQSFGGYKQEYFK